MNTVVPNKHPSVRNVSYKIAIIGEAPGEREVDQGEPFVGPSGFMLNDLLSKNQILRDACFIGNICQQRPPDNDLDLFVWSGPEIQSGLVQLGKDLDQFQPHMCLLLGKTALFSAKRDNKIGNWRGSLLLGEYPPFVGRKCIASYHPAAIRRQYKWKRILQFDIKKCKENATSPEYIPPQRHLIIATSFDELMFDLERIRAYKPLISVDIEGGIGTMSCVGIATSATEAFIIPLAKISGQSIFNGSDEEVQVWQLLANILEDPAIPKVLQNSLYDRFVLQYSYNIVMQGVVDDTMLKHWELYCELEKSLAFQVSIYTNESYYKSDRKSDDQNTFYRYCCNDAAVTYEINQKLEQYL